MQVEKRNLKIARLDGKDKILDFSDMLIMERSKKYPERLDEGKIVLSFTDYGSNKVYMQHFIDVATARVLFTDILSSPYSEDGSPVKLLDEFKGGWGKSVKHPEIEHVSRKLSVSYRTKDGKGEALKIGPCVVFEFTLTEGVKTEQGVVTPKRGAEPLSKGMMMIPLSVARKAAATVLDYIRCKETSAMMSGRITNLWNTSSTEDEEVE